MIGMKSLKIKIEKTDIAFKGKVVYHNPQYGKVKLDTTDLGSRALCIFYNEIKEFDNFYIVNVDEILNKGVKNMSHYSSAIYLHEKYIGKECIVCVLD